MNLKLVADQNISDKVASRLREAIQNGELKPGSRLVERTLADQMGVSHIPVREALAKLADEGLVEREPRRGARVARLSERDLREISSLRIVLEQFVSRRVQERWTPTREAQLRKIVAAMVTSSEKGDIDAMFSLDRRFHESLWSMADHYLLVTMATQLHVRIHGFIRAANSALSTSDLAEHANSHFAILDAIASGVPETVDRVIAQHITIATERISVDEASAR